MKTSQMNNRPGWGFIWLYLDGTISLHTLITMLQDIEREMEQARIEADYDNTIAGFEASTGRM